MTEIRTPTHSTASLSGLVDALDAIIANGVSVGGDVVIALDGIDLIRLDLRLLLAGIEGVPAEEARS
jgi:hypothetical protein